MTTTEEQLVEAANNVIDAAWAVDESLGTRCSVTGQAEGNLRIALQAHRAVLADHLAATRYPSVPTPPMLGTSHRGPFYGTPQEFHAFVATLAPHPVARARERFISALMDAGTDTE